MLLHRRSWSLLSRSIWQMIVLVECRALAELRTAVGP
jgi:hypothetical protein